MQGLTAKGQRYDSKGRGMNLVDNGIKQVIEIERLIEDEELYFLVKFIDWYGRQQEKHFMSIKNLESRRWME